MGVSVAVIRRDQSATELRSLAGIEVGAVACRLLAIGPMLDGASQADAAASCGMAGRRMVFDDMPAALTEDVARTLYGLEAKEVMEHQPRAEAVELAVAVTA